MIWRDEEIAFDLVDDLTIDPVTTTTVTVPEGTLMMMANVTVEVATMSLRGLHIQGSVPNRIGPANLLALARIVMERIGVDGLEIEGAARTTGVRPGRRPRVVRIARSDRSSSVDRDDGE